MYICSNIYTPGYTVSHTILNYIVEDSGFYGKKWCESLDPGYLVPRRNEPGFVQRKIQEKSDFSIGSVLKYF